MKHARTVALALTLMLLLPGLAPAQPSTVAGVAPEAEVVSPIEVSASRIVLPESAARVGRIRELVPRLEEPMRDRARRTASTQPVRDSLKNGAIIGAVIGAVASVVVTRAACGLDKAAGGDDGCGNEMVLAAAIGAGLGAATGAGVDALFQRVPGPLGGASASRVTVRLRMRF